MPLESYCKIIFRNQTFGPLNVPIKLKDICEGLQINLRSIPVLIKLDTDGQLNDDGLNKFRYQKYEEIIAREKKRTMPENSGTLSVNCKSNSCKIRHSKSNEFSIGTDDSRSIISGNSFSTNSRSSFGQSSRTHSSSVRSSACGDDDNSVHRSSLSKQSSYSESNKSKTSSSKNLNSKSASTNGIQNPSTSDSGDQIELPELNVDAKVTSQSNSQCSENGDLGMPSSNALDDHHESQASNMPLSNKIDSLTNSDYTSSSPSSSSLYESESRNSSESYDDTVSQSRSSSSTPSKGNSRKINHKQPRSFINGSLSSIPELSEPSSRRASEYSGPSISENNSSNRTSATGSSGSASIEGSQEGKKLEQHGFYQESDDQESDDQESDQENGQDMHYGSVLKVDGQGRPSGSGKTNSAVSSDQQEHKMDNVITDVEAEVGAGLYELIIVYYDIPYEPIRKTVVDILYKSVKNSETQTSAGRYCDSIQKNIGRVLAKTNRIIHSKDDDQTSVDQFSDISSDMGTTNLHSSNKLNLSLRNIKMSINEMVNLISNLPDRYIKFNVILSTNIKRALREVERLQKIVRDNVSDDDLIILDHEDLFQDTEKVVNTSTRKLSKEALESKRKDNEEMYGADFEEDTGIYCYLFVIIF